MYEFVMIVFYKQTELLRSMTSDLQLLNKYVMSLIGSFLFDFGLKKVAGLELPYFARFHKLRACTRN